MAEALDKKIDEAMATLAREITANAPRPDTDLVARVLADAAAMAPAPLAEGRAERGLTVPAQRQSLTDLIFGWTGGALAAPAVCERSRSGAPELAGREITRKRDAGDRGTRCRES